MGQALYRKYRSKSLDEIVGQSHIIDMLKRAIAADKVAHAYLLTGPRGVGKTSIARILAHEINQLPYTDESTHLDIIEIDAASNNSVEDIRDLRDKVQIAPTSAKYKVYIIDEVHMLSKPAFNALLKTLEEPPSHIVFILATTDVDKLPATILSRVQRFNFRLIHAAEAVKHLRTIADAEQIAIDDEALALIADHGGGSFRDSISLLDQLQHISDDTITRALIEKVLGLAETKLIDQLLDAYRMAASQTIVTLLDDSEQRGTPAVVLTEQLIRTVRGRVLNEPELLPLLDALLDVTKSAWPDVKLLIALTGAAQSTQRQVSSAVEGQKNTQATPPESSSRPHAKEQPVGPKRSAESPQTAEKPPKTPAAEADTSAFNQHDFIAAVKQSTPGTGALLAKCGFKPEPHGLVIYANNKFNKTRLEKAKPELLKALEAQSITNDITILTEAAPPSNSQTAAVLDIMGGGEEVRL